MSATIIPLRRREERRMHLAQVLHAAIDQRHDAVHGGDRFQCVDPVCAALSELQTEAQR